MNKCLKILLAVFAFCMVTLAFMFFDSSYITPSILPANFKEFTQSRNWSFSNLEKRTQDNSTHLVGEHNSTSLEEDHQKKEATLASPSESPSNNQTHRLHGLGKQPQQNVARVPRESHLLPIRGVGDSLLPFQPEYAARVSKFPTDLYKEKPLGVDPPDPDNPPLKKILFWNDAYSSKHFGVGYGREPFLRANCPVNTCMTTSDRKRFPYEKIDAVIWHFRASDRSLPSKRSPHTRYVFWMMESASYLFGNLEPYKNVFNYTLTYRLDSDLPNPYGRVFRRRDPVELKDYANITAGKTKMAAWFVSNCQSSSSREALVKQLKKYIKVDVYGRCGKLKCDRKDQWGTCYAMLNRDYKFYLSFENSLCLDYTTEKFFNMLKLDIIPVVYGFGNYSTLAPPHSYINALDFPSAEALAEYLIYLDNNQTAYNEYFRWKAFHHLPTDWDKRMFPYCKLCNLLHSDHETKTYDMKRWFVDKAACKHSFEQARNSGHTISFFCMLIFSFFLFVIARLHKFTNR